MNWCVDSRAWNTQTCVEKIFAIRLWRIVITLRFFHSAATFKCQSHWGLAILIHHNFGSKTLIKSTVQWATVCLLMSLDTFSHQWQQARCQEQKAVSTSLMVSDACDHGIVDAAIDNFDQNKDTLDGKHTTPYYGNCCLLKRPGLHSREKHSKGFVDISSCFKYLWLGWRKTTLEKLGRCVLFGFD